MQCPYIHASLEQVKRFCGERGAPVTLIPVDSLQRAKELPGVFNNWAVFYRGRLETVNLLDEAGLCLLYTSGKPETARRDAREEVLQCRPRNAHLST